MGPPNVIRRVDCAQMEEASASGGEAICPVGHLRLDFIRDDAGDVHLIEINPRTTQGGTLAFGEDATCRRRSRACVTRCAVTRREAIANDVVAFFPAEWQRDAQSPYLVSGYHNVPWDDPAVLKACFDALPHAETPARKAAMQMLITTAPKHEGERLAPVFG